MEILCACYGRKRMSCHVNDGPMLPFTAVACAAIQLPKSGPSRQRFLRRLSGLGIHTLVPEISLSATV